MSVISEHHLMLLQPFGPEPLLTCRPESGSGFSPPALIQTPDPSLVTFSGSAACLSEKCRNLKLFTFFLLVIDRFYGNMNRIRSELRLKT